MIFIDKGWRIIYDVNRYVCFFAGVSILYFYKNKKAAPAGNGVRNARQIFREAKKSRRES